MAWDAGKNRIKKWEDTNEKLSQLEGELTDQEAMETFAEYLFANPSICLELLANLKIYPLQELMIKGWMRNDYSMAIWGRGMSKCIDINSSVLTNKGIIPIKNVEVGDNIYAEKGVQKVLNKWFNPEEDGFKVTTKKGYSFIAKKGHKFKIYDPETFETKFINIEDTRLENLIPIKVGPNYWGNQSLDFDSKVKEKFLVNIENDLDFYYYIGRLLGDDCTTHKIGITSPDKEMIDFLIDYYKKIAPENNIKQYKKVDNETSGACISNQNLTCVLESLGFDLSLHSVYKKIPSKLLSVSGDKIAMILRGLFDTGGYVSLMEKEEKKSISCLIGYSSSSKEMAKQVHTLLLNFGVVSSFALHSSGEKNKLVNGQFCETQDDYKVIITGSKYIEKFNQIIGFGLTRKRERVEKYLALKNPKSLYFDNVIPNLRKALKKKFTHCGFKKEEFELHDSMNLEKLKEIFPLIPEGKEKNSLKELIDSDFYIDKIESIIPWKTQTCDITVDKEECYWSDGAIHHNSFTAAVFCLFWSVFNPDNRIILISFVFRATRRILEQIEKFVNADGAHNIKSCFPSDLQKRNDEWKWALPNGASIVCLPLGDGTKIRGFRADTLIIDEYNYMNSNVITEVIQPFLVSSNNVSSQMEIDRIEDKLVAQGKIRNDQRTTLDENIKVIALSSAGFQFEDMYKKYSYWVSNIMEGGITKRDSGEEEVRLGVGENISYFVSRLSYEAAPKGLLNAKVIEEARQGASQSVFDREYRAIFTADSDSYYSAKKMVECTIPNGQSPCMEIEGDNGSEYILSIDPSFSSAEHSDYFAMVILKIVKKDGKKIPLLVHCYAVAGGSLKDHTLYLYFLLKKFNVVYVAIDSSGGDSNEFINSSNNSKLFKDSKIELLDIQADFAKHDNSDLIKEIKKSYNLQQKRIVQKQHFGAGNFLRSANEYMQGCFDRKNLMFAGKINSNANELSRISGTSMDILKDHKSFKDIDIEEFIEDQDNWIDVTKQECALIEISTSALGTMSFDLPLSLRRSKQANRVRKDLYSALLLGNWAFKLYIECLNEPEVKTFATFAPFLG